jgi:hypothetical protein
VFKILTDEQVVQWAEKNGYSRIDVEKPGLWTGIINRKAQLSQDEASLKPPEDLREEVEEIIKPLAKNYVLSYIHQLNRLESELMRVLDGYVNPILSLFTLSQAKAVREERERIYQEWRKDTNDGELPTSLHFGEALSEEVKDDKGTG